MVGVVVIGWNFMDTNNIAVAITASVMFGGFGMMGWDGHWCWWYWWLCWWWWWCW
jgi:hypothetical protein